MTTSGSGSSTVQFRVRFVKFSNTRHMMSDGQRCDSGWFSSNKCDPHFTVCFTTTDATWTHSVQPVWLFQNPIFDNILWNDTVDPLATCDFAGPFTFGPYDNTAEVTFGEQLNTLKNPFVFNITHAWRGVEMRIRINERERGSFLGANTAKGPPPSGGMLRLRMTGSTAANTSLQLESRIQCLPHYYDSECSTYCVPRPDDHFTCDSRTGQSVCEPGWTGDFCNAKMLSENLNIHPLTFGSQTDDVVAYEMEVTNSSEPIGDALPTTGNITLAAETLHTDPDGGINPIHVQVVRMEGTTIHEEEGHEPYFEKHSSNVSAEAVTSGGMATVHPTPSSTVWPLTVSLLMGSLTYLATTSPSTESSTTEKKTTVTSTSDNATHVPATTLSALADLETGSSSTSEATAAVISLAENHTVTENSIAIPNLLIVQTSVNLTTVTETTVSSKTGAPTALSEKEQFGKVKDFDELEIVELSTVAGPSTVTDSSAYDIVQIVYATQPETPVMFSAPDHNNTTLGPKHANSLTESRKLYFYCTYTKQATQNTRHALPESLGTASDLRLQDNKYNVFRQGVAFVHYDVPLGTGLTASSIHDSSFLDKLNWTIYQVARERLQERSETSGTTAALTTSVELTGLSISNQSMQPTITVYALANQTAVFTPSEFRVIIQAALHLLDAHNAATLYAGYIPHSPGIIMFIAALCVIVVILLGIVIILARSSHSRYRLDSPFSDGPPSTSHNCSLMVSAFDNPMFQDSSSELCPADDIVSLQPSTCAVTDNAASSERVYSTVRSSDLSHRSGSHPPIARIRTTSTFKQLTNGGTL
ncbi:uncharacterized protein LOC129591392 [Paramacrobiotus metropolitanus]|uniref:uncharacterized protein LOC129591392 n=1 Tax=Paramacrobiotus metropolitanus TaxID=2943436 RepID=UPI002445803F|nr:uncharacterized protein LOC129591392 [Paramacrobiotus metropolitanus]